MLHPHQAQWIENVLHTIQRKVESDYDLRYVNLLENVTSKKMREILTKVVKT